MQIMKLTNSSSQSLSTKKELLKVEKVYFPFSVHLSYAPLTHYSVFVKPFIPLCAKTHRNGGLQIRPSKWIFA